MAKKKSKANSAFKKVVFLLALPWLLLIATIVIGFTAAFALTH